MSYSTRCRAKTNVGQEELFVCNAGDTKLTPVNVKKWKDQQLFDLHWNGTVDHAAHGPPRSDATSLRAASISTLPAKATTPLLNEDIENNSSERQNVRYVKAGGDLIWWSERTGWGHYYLYDNTGHLKRALTSGAWRAERSSTSTR